jgi:hypothetical protein
LVHKVRQEQMEQTVLMELLVRKAQQVLME